MKGADIRLRVKLVPCEGFDIRRAGGGEYLVVSRADSTKNTIVDADTLAQVFVDLANGGLTDPWAFNHGFGSYWRIEEVAETY